MAQAVGKVHSAGVVGTSPGSSAMRPSRMVEMPAGRFKAHSSDLCDRCA
jgi:hypothetical protein